MKYLTTFAFVASLAGIAGMAACSSGSSSSGDNGGGGNSSTGGAAHGGAATAGAATGGAATAGAATGGAASGGAAGAGTAGAGTAGGAGASGAGTGGASAGAGGATNGGAGGASGGSGGSSAVVATCGTQMYTPTATPGAACVTKAVPTGLVSAFEAAGVAPGWGVYPNVDGMTGFVPTTATPSPGGANGTANALSFAVTGLTQGIKIQVGFGSQCQDVRTFQGLSFWAKGTIDAATVPFAVDANTLVLFLGSENTAQGGCTASCSTAPNDRRVTITADWKEYRIPFSCFGNAMGFDGYYTNILFNAFGTNSSFAIDQVGYY